MTVYVVWDNDDYGSLMSHSRDEIDSIYLRRTEAEAKVVALNRKKPKGYTKARLTAQRVT